MRSFDSTKTEELPPQVKPSRAKGFIHVSVVKSYGLGPIIPVSWPKTVIVNEKLRNKGKIILNIMVVFQFCGCSSLKKTFISAQHKFLFICGLI